MIYSQSHIPHYIDFNVIINKMLFVHAHHTSVSLKIKIIHIKSILKQWHELITLVKILVNWQSQRGLKVGHSYI